MMIYQQPYRTHFKTWNLQLNFSERLRRESSVGTSKFSKFVCVGAETSEFKNQLKSHTP